MSERGNALPVNAHP